VVFAEAKSRANAQVSATFTFADPVMSWHPASPVLLLQYVAMYDRQFGSSMPPPRQAK
jgi:hypothetical protein